MSYAKFDRIVAEHERKDAELAAKQLGLESPEDIAQQAAFLESLPVAMRNNPQLLKSLKTSNSFKHMMPKTKITRSDVEAWAATSSTASSTTPIPTQPSAPSTPLPTYESQYSAIETAIASSQTYKARGNACFKADQLQKAIQEYTKGIKEIDTFKASSNNSAAKDVWVAMLSNRAQCSLQLQQYSSTILDCTKILLKQSNHVKALWRRSQALVATEDITGAASDIRDLLRLEPTNKKAKRALKKMIALEKSKYGTSDHGGAAVANNVGGQDETTLLFRKETKTLVKAIKNQNVPVVKDLLPSYVKQIEDDLLTHVHWQSKMAILYSSGMDDALLSLMSLLKAQVNEEKEQVKEEVKEEEEEEEEETVLDLDIYHLLKHVRTFFNVCFARLMKYTDEKEDDNRSHFFGSTMMSSRAHVRALLRTTMTGNKTTLERLKTFMMSSSNQSTFDRPQIWICNADRELMNRIRYKDKEGALFHAFEGEMYRHMISGTLYSTFFSIGEKKGGIEYLMSNAVQNRLKSFVKLSTMIDLE